MTELAWWTLGRGAKQAENLWPLVLNLPLVFESWIPNQVDKSNNNSEREISQASSFPWTPHNVSPSSSTIADCSPQRFLLQAGVHCCFPAYACSDGVSSQWSRPSLQRPPSTTVYNYCMCTRNTGATQAEQHEWQLKPEWRHYLWTYFSQYNTHQSKH